MIRWHEIRAKFGFAPEQMTEQDNEFIRAFHYGGSVGLSAAQEEITKEIGHQRARWDRAMGIGSYDEARTINTFIVRLEGIQKRLTNSEARFPHDREQVA